MCVCVFSSESVPDFSGTHAFNWKADARTVVVNDSSALQLFFSLLVLFFPSGKQSYSGTHASPDKLSIKFSSVVIYWSLLVQSLLQNLMSQNKRRKGKPHRLHAVVSPSPESSSKHIQTFTFPPHLSNFVGDESNIFQGETLRVTNGAIKDNKRGQSPAEPLIIVSFQQHPS